MHRAPRPSLKALLGLTTAGLLGLSSCSQPDLVVYVSLDQEFSQELIQEFEKQTGLNVRAEYDTEANKTVGLVQRIIEEAKVPRCDVYWNNEVAQTVRLANMGFLASYTSPSGTEIPDQFKDPGGRWTGFAARARCLIVNTDLVPNPESIRGMWDLLDPQWAGRVAFARPLTGTTLTHACALFDAIGEEAALRYLTTIAKGSALENPPVHVAQSNGRTRQLVESGQLAWAWTDTDDFNVARLKGAPVMRILPDQEPGPEGQPPLGTLLIPNTIAILKDAPHRSAAERFVDWVLSEEIEERMAFSRSAQIPVRASVPRPPHVASDLVAMRVSYAALGAQIADRARTLKELFLNP
ncbi:MAG: extracellular solute-binding protein [bacterium]